MNSQFIGTWILEKIEDRSTDGKEESRFGNLVIGQLMYDNHGYMSVQIMKQNRSSFKSGDHRNGTSKEIKTAFEGYIAYWGTYHVNIKDEYVIHKPLGSILPNRIGKEHKRIYEFSNNGQNLKLTADPFIWDKKEIISSLFWNKA